MTVQVTRHLIRFWFSVALLVASSTVFADCLLTSNELAPETVETPVDRLVLAEGLQRISLSCNVSQPSILHFERNYIAFAQLYDDKMQQVQSLRSSRASFVIPQGQHTFVLDVSAQVSVPLNIKVSSLFEYQKLVSVHTLTLSVFIGFCLALTVYVGILGNSIKNNGFYSYSFYVLNAAIFFLLQEGLMNIVFPSVNFFNDFQFHLFFAGITVFAAVNFLDKLLDFKALLRHWQRNFIVGMAYLAMFLAFLQVFLSSANAMKVNELLSLITLITMVCTFSSCVYACVRKVHCSYLVMSGIAIMVSAMSFRLILGETSVFLYRYGLIIGITLEAFIFAVATSRKVKKLDDDRLAAFKRASTDALCAVLNRSGWEGVARNVLDTFNKEGGFLTLLFIDLDDFKAVNDAYGHATGDDILRVIAKILKSRCRDQDVVGRLGGDEFVVLSHCYSEKQAKRLAERIEDSLLERDIRTDNYSIPITASVGTYITNEKCKSVDELLDKADALMYVTKARHKKTLVTEGIQGTF